MGIENLKRWHWVVIAVLLGLLGAWIQLQMGPLGMQSSTATLGQDTFERAVLGLPWIRGTPQLEDVSVYPLDDGKLLVTAYMPVGEPKKNEDGQYAQVWKTHQLIRGRPYLPTFAPDVPPHVQVKFDASTGGGRRWGRGQATVREDGWAAAGRGLRDPGADGAELGFRLRKADYDLLVRLGPESAKRGNELKLTLNGKPLGRLAPDARVPYAWRGTVPATAITDGPQVLKVARGDQPVHVAAVDLTNPQYSLLDFLTDAKSQNKDLSFNYRGAWEPRKAYTYWMVGSVVLVGLVWPTLLNVLIGAGLGRPPTGPEYDLSRFKGEPAPAQAAAPAPVDDEQLAALEADLLRNLEADAVARAEEPAAAAPEPVRELEAVPLETPATAQEEEGREYKGEFYPVARKAEKH